MGADDRKDGSEETADASAGIIVSVIYEVKRRENGGLKKIWGCGGK